MLLLQIIAITVCLLSIPCHGFVPGAPRRAFLSSSKLGVSVSGDLMGRYNNANQTAMDVLESLDFLANIKHREEESGVPLFEATREVVDEEEETTTEGLTLEAATGVDIDEVASELQFEASVNAVERSITDVNTGVVMGEREADFAAAMNGEVDVLHQVSASKGGKKNKKKKGKKADTSKNSEDESTSKPGIGGSGGTVYNVNRLKKNLVQEMVSSYKREMWDDLGEPSVDLSIVEDKLASLVQSTAVKCTTDSNLLDGQWTFAFGSRQSAAALMDPNRFDIAARRTTKTQAVKSAKTEGLFHSSSRTFCLENMDDDEDAHMLDRTRYFAGMFGKVRRYNVARLTRTTLMLEPSTQQTYFCGKRIREKKAKEQSQQMEDLRILYVDNDLCLSTSGDLATSPFYVYTKSKEWVGRTQRMKRGARRVFGAMRRVRNSFFNIIFLRRRIRKAVVAKVTSDDSAASDRILVDIDDESKRLTVLKLGDLENDAKAWEGEEDPFVHLSADERQEQLKKMRVRDVRRAGRKQRRQNTRKGKRTETRKPFKKPE